jgi:RNA recognition motif-containing protein
MLNIYIGNLPFTTTEADLNQLFSQFGNIAKVSLIADRETGRSRGFGFVEMPDDAQGKTAIEALNGKEFGGRYLTVNEARPRTERGGAAAATGAPAPAPARSGYGNRNTGASSREA